MFDEPEIEHTNHEISRNWLDNLKLVLKLRPKYRSVYTVNVAQLSGLSDNNNGPSLSLVRDSYIPNVLAPPNIEVKCKKES